MAIISKERHMERMNRVRHTTWYPEEVKNDTPTSVLDDLRHDHKETSSREPENSSVNSLVDSYKASMEEARLNIKYKEKDLLMIRKENKEFNQRSDELFRKSEQGLRDKEDEINHMWDRLEMMQSYHVDRIAQKRTCNMANDKPFKSDGHMPINKEAFF